MFEPKVGDVVALKSNPDHHMTVVSYQNDKKLYDVVWIAQGGLPNGFGVTAQALVKVESAVFDPDKHPAVQARLAELGEQMGHAVSAVTEVQAIKSELASCKREAIAVIEATRTTLPDLPRDVTLAVAVASLVRTAETWKREGNEQIAALQGKLQQYTA